MLFQVRHPVAAQRSRSFRRHDSDTDDDALADDASATSSDPALPLAAYPSERPAQDWEHASRRRLVVALARYKYVSIHIRISALRASG